MNRECSTWSNMLNTFIGEDQRLCMQWPSLKYLCTHLPSFSCIYLWIVKQPCFLENSTFLDSIEGRILHWKRKNTSINAAETIFPTISVNYWFEWPGIKYVWSFLLVYECILYSTAKQSSTCPKSVPGYFTHWKGTLFLSSNASAFNTISTSTWCTIKEQQTITGTPSSTYWHSLRITVSSQLNVQGSFQQNTVSNRTN